MTRPWRLGVIGAGWFASRRHCPEIVSHPRTELTALCRRDETALASMGEAFDVSDLYTDYRDLIAQGKTDAVLICSPHDLHYEHTLAALEAGLHVLLEKPITVDPAHARQLAAKARQVGRILLVAQNPPYWRHCERLRQAFDQELGTLETGMISWSGNALGVLGREPLPPDLPGVVPPTLFRGDAEAQGGFLVDGGSHLLCELLWCTGLKATSITAQMDDSQADVRAALTLQMENGAMVSLVQTADSAIRDKRQRNVYYGSAGTATVTGFPFTLTVEAAGHCDHWTEAELPEVPTPVQDLVDAMEGRGSGRIAVETAVHVVEILDAAYEAAAGGRRISI